MGKGKALLIKMKWLGLIGLLGTLTGNEGLKLFWLFFLLGFLEVVDNLAVFYPSVLQLISYPLMAFKYLKGLPSKENYRCQTAFSLPFEGEWLVANGGYDPESSHSWHVWPQRYAFDFLIVDENENTYKNDVQTLTDYYCYGQPVCAPAEGEVIEAVDAYPDSPVFGEGRVVCLAKDLRGNFITIRHQSNELTTIAHLMPGSIQVKVGDTVTPGQRIAACGNSGNSSEPHIHFQLNDGRNFFTSAGLPIDFENVQVIGGDGTSSAQSICRGQRVQNKF